MIKITTFVRASKESGVSPVNYYRALLPVRAVGLNDNRFDVRILTQDDVRTILRNGYGDAIMGEDIYVVSRLYADKGREEFMKAMRARGSRVVFDTDDDLTCDHRELDRGNEFKNTIASVDLVTVSTPHLSKKLEPYVGYRPPVLYNHVDFEWFSKISLEANRKIDGLVIGMIGTTSHERDWGYPVEALLRLASEFDNISIMVAGYVPPYLEDVENLVKLNAVPYKLYPGLMRQFDIVCCSLDPDDEFNKSKSSIKALESMSAARVLSNGRVGGAVPVCTDMSVYRRTVNKHNGVLTSNDDWYKTLRSLIVDEQLRNKLAVQGHNWIQKHRDICTGYKSWSKLYRDLVGGKYDDLPRTSQCN